MSDDAQHAHGTAADTDEDELHRRFREALQRKKDGSAQADAAHGGEAGGGRVGPARDVTRRRQFRRKSGG